jgi:hypothetical protein
VDLYADRTRLLPGLDPEGRELVMSCGVALFYLRLALRQHGYAGAVTLFPEPDTPDLLARVEPGAAQPPPREDTALFQAIPRRHTNRFTYSGWAVPQEVRRALCVAAEQEGATLTLILHSGPRYAITSLIAEADRRQWSDPRVRDEKAFWVQTGTADRPDGIPPENIGLEDWAAHMGTESGSGAAGERLARRDERLAVQAPLLAVLSTPGDTRQDWLAAGQALGRLLLRATLFGVTASFFNQPIQVAALRPHLPEALKTPGQPQALLRLGYGAEVPATPRRSVSDVLREE